MKISVHGLALELRPVSPLNDEDWCRVGVHADVAMFQGNFVAYLQGADIVHFLKEVRALYANVGKPGHATLTCAEPGLEIELSMQALGSIVGRYKFQGEFRDGGAPTLTGGFEMDQSHLPQIIDGIEALHSSLKRT